MSNNIHIDISVYVFKEEDVYIAYCPSLDLSGYGESEMEAKKSFDSDLIHHGWRFGKTIQYPKITSLIRHNETFKNLLDNVDYKKYSKTYQPTLV